MSIEAWEILLLGIGIGACVWGVLLVVQYFVLRRITEVSHPLLRVLRHTHYLFIFFVAAYSTLWIVEIPQDWALLFKRLFVAALAIQLGLWGNQIILYAIKQSPVFRESSDEIGSIAVINFLGKVTVWSLVVIFLLGNWGFDITALIAGLGISGIAIALAVQNILGDLFASLSIVIDRPFRIGDMIFIDNYKGNVEHIGLKTTRLRSLNGEELIFSNADLLKSRVSNYKRMRRRRALFTIGIAMDASVEKLRAVPEMVKKIVTVSDDVTFDRCHFKDIGDFSYNFEVVYWVEKPDMGLYLDIQQQINLTLLEELQKHGLFLAYPTYTYIKKTEE